MSLVLSLTWPSEEGGRTRRMLALVSGVRAPCSGVLYWLCEMMDELRLDVSMGVDDPVEPCIAVISTPVPKLD